MEILLILAIVVLVFGVGKVKNIGAALGRSGKEFKKALDGEPEETTEGQPIDITPKGDQDEVVSPDPKPGTRKQPIDEAEVVEET